MSRLSSKILGPAVDGDNIIYTYICAELFYDIEPLLERVHEDELFFRGKDRKWDPRKPCSRPHICYHAGLLILRQQNAGKRIKIVLSYKILRLSDSSKVDMFIPLEYTVHVCIQFVYHLAVPGYLVFFKIFYKDLHCFPLLIFSRYTSSTLMSAGETPDILEACPTEAGLIWSSFW